jgi:hypothetical protein
VACPPVLPACPLGLRSGPVGWWSGQAPVGRVAAMNSWIQGPRLPRASRWAGAGSAFGMCRPVGPGQRAEARSAVHPSVDGSALIASSVMVPPEGD